MKQFYKKKIFNFKTSFQSFGDVLKALRKARPFLKKNIVSKAFSERVMIAITNVNGCVYCSWFHSKQAVKSGVSKKEITELFDFKFAELPDREIPAIIFAVQWAEANKRPEKAMLEEFESHYSKNEILALKFFMNAIYVGNLAGNTFDTFLSRLKGLPAQKSSIIFETIFFLISAPFLLPTLPFIKRSEKV